MQMPVRTLVGWACCGLLMTSVVSAVADEIDELFGVEALLEEASESSDDDLALELGDAAPGDTADLDRIDDLLDGGSAEADAAADDDLFGDPEPVGEADLLEDDSAVAADVDPFGEPPPAVASVATTAQVEPIDAAALPEIPEEDMMDVERGLDALEVTMLKRDMASSREVTMLTALLEQKEDELDQLRGEVASLRDATMAPADPSPKVEAAVPDAAPSRDSSDYNRGCKLYEAGRYEEAVLAFREALRVDPNDSASHYNLGIVLSDYMDKPDMARRHYHRFVELVPDGPDSAQVREWMMTLGLPSY